MKTLCLSIIAISLVMFGAISNASGTLTTSESKIQLLTGKPAYVPGEKIQIIGAFSPNDLIHIDLINPLDGTKNSTLLQSDKTGHFRTNYVVPSNAVNGTWKILATSGINHASLDVQVISSNYAIKNENITNPYGSGGFVTKIESPLKQFHSGVALLDIKCVADLQLLIKANSRSPACVKAEDVSKLVERGWGTLMSPDIHQTSDASSVLRLDLSVKNDTIKSGQSVGIELSLVNTLSKPIKILAANDWPNNYLTISECSPFYPIGVSILKGYHTEQNMTGITPLSLYSGYGCIIPQSLVPSYTFQPLSNKVTPICEFTVSCPQLIVMKSQLSYSGYFDNNEQFHPFDTGTYTIVGGDEWGHIAIQHFKVINSTQTYTTYDQPNTVQTNDVHGTMKNIKPSMTFSELASSSTGVQISRGGGLSTYDNDSIKLELDYGKTSDSQVISATVENLGKRTVHIYGISISGFIQIATDSFMGTIVILDDPSIIPKDNAILEPGESQTKYIEGNWTVKGKPVNGFSAGTLYSYDNLQNYDGMTNGYSISVPIRWIQ